MSVLAITAMTFAQVKPQEVKKDTTKTKTELKTDSLKKVSNMKKNQYNQPPVKDTTKIKK